MCSHVYRKHTSLLTAPQESRTKPTTNIIVHGSCLYSTTTIDLNFDQALSETLSHDIHQLLLHTDAFEHKKKSILFLMHL